MRPTDKTRNQDLARRTTRCTLIVTAANEFTRRINDRMRVLLGHKDRDAWLTGKAASSCCGRRQITTVTIANRGRIG